MQETWLRSLGREDPLEKEMATHSSILACEITWTEEPGGLQSMGSQRVGHILATKPPPPPPSFNKLTSSSVFSYIVTGDIRGNIKFYDHTLSIVNWYSHFKLSSIRSLSFSKTPAAPPAENTNYPPDCTLKSDDFVVRWVVNCCCCSVTECPSLCDPMDHRQHARLPCPSLSFGACSNSCPVSWWCHPTISSCVIPFSSCPQSFPASGSFPVSRLFTSGGQSIGASASVSVFPMNIQSYFL